MNLLRFIFKQIFIVIFLLHFTNAFKLKAQALTYHQNTKSIIDKHCVSCHQPGGNAPFSLQNYTEVKNRGTFIKYVINQHIMPPWKADQHYRQYANARILSDEEKKVLIQWIDEGMKVGEPNPKKLIIKNKEKKADLVIKMPRPLTIPATLQNSYFCYKIPYEISQDTFVSSVTFVAGNKTLVHHASYQVLGVSDDVNPFDGPYYFKYDEDTLNRVNDSADYRYLNLIGKSGVMPIEYYHNGWLPGTTEQKYPEGIGFFMPKKGVILIRNLHYAPTAIEQTDQSSFEFKFMQFPPERFIGFAAFKPANKQPDGRWIIKANDSNFKAVIHVKFHQDVSVLNINPHMHRLGKTFLCYAITPEKDTIKLVKINRWDHNWQEFYRFTHMVKIPAGSVLHAEAIYDNSEQNAENPNHPPKDVRFEWGMNDDSEMMRLVLLYLPYEINDEYISLE
ncbi:MAG: hypothetical protein MUC81_07970 [Bacteroidia bacterium]|nr:hypothetical protein [Bacteroidia bacterium]